VEKKDVPVIGGSRSLAQGLPKKKILERNERRSAAITYYGRKRSPAMSLGAYRELRGGYIMGDND